MAHFLDACHVLENMVVALYDAMFTQSIRKEERNSFFSPENLFILKLVVDVRKCLKNGYLRKVDKQMPWYHMFMELLIPHHQKCPA